MLPPVLEHMEKLGHRVFASGDYDLNLFGIRSPDRTAGTFNDLMGCAYKVDGVWNVQYWPATTDPGVYYRENPMSVRGTAILQPGQYRGVYKIDKHGGKYDALCQRNGTVKCWRDSDMDSELDLSPDVDEAEGYFGINLHASSSKPYDDNRDRNEEEAEARDVGRWSAGCQVHASSHTFRAMMTLAKKQLEEHPNWSPAFTYTLMDQWW